MEQTKLDLTYLRNMKEKIKKHETYLMELKEMLKKNQKNQEIIKSFDSIDKNIIYFNFLFFQKFTENIGLNINNKNNLLFQSFNLSQIKKESNNIYNVMLQWIYYLYMELIFNICYAEIEINSTEINKLNNLFEQTFDISIALYNTNIFSSKKIFDILYFFLFLIENNFNINFKVNNFDKLYNIKNYILLKTFFNFFGNISYIVLDKANINNKKDKDIETIDDENYKKEITEFFEFLKYLEESKEINYRLNRSILLNNNILNDFFIKKIFETINIKSMHKYERNFKNKLINFYANFANCNYDESKIFPNIMESLKISFKNLYDFNQNKERIYKDLFIQGFNAKLIKNLILYEENSSLNKNIYPPSFNSFFFNSYNSKIHLNIKTKKFLENFSLFFSINLSPKSKSENIYPILIINKNNNEIIFNLSLKYIEKENSYVFILDNENLILKNRIVPGTTYYINISFIQNKIILNYYNGKKIDNEERNINIRSLESDNYGLIFGNNNNNTFSGYIGPIIIIKYLSNTKDREFYELINTVLKMNIYYKYFILCKKNSNYYFENLNLFQKNNIINNAKIVIEKYNFECLLYLTPDILYKANIELSSSNKNINLSNIDDICTLQKNYEIKSLNITLVKNNQSDISFISENGLNYLCLLYEYLYQFLRRLEENDNKIDKEYQNIINSIIKKTIFIINKFSFELDVFSLNKSFKQIFMNLFQCIKLISKYYCIMNDILDIFFNITAIFRNSISDIDEKRGNNSIIIINIKDNLLQLNCSYLNGLIDFLLNPQLYDFTNSKILINLFDHLKTYFYFGNEEEVLMIINQYFYYKILNFAPYLNNYYEESESNENQKAKNDVNEARKNLITKNYFDIIKLFFTKNKEKNMNTRYLKYILNLIQENLDNNNYDICLFFCKFINELIKYDADLYFSYDSNKKDIRIILSFIKKVSVDKEELLIDEENILSCKEKILNILLSIVIKIVFSKNKNNTNKNLVEEFKNILQNININNNIMNNISNEIINMINQSLYIEKNNIDEDQQKEIINKNEELKYLSDFYASVFDFIKFLIEYPSNGNNYNNIQDLNIYNEKVFYMLIAIKSSLKGNFKNMSLFNIDSIYCIIYLIKFYHDIFMERLYPEKYIQEFIDICEICIKSCLLYSNILIKFENCSKIILEIILDTFLNYILVTTNHYCKPLSPEKINELTNEIIIKEQEMIYYFLIYFIPKIDKKEKIKNYTIFYLNDYLNFLAGKDQTGKKLSRRDSSLENIREYPNYKTIYNLLLKENKFNLNVSIYFLIKIFGYNKLLIESTIAIGQAKFKEKGLLKYNEILQLFGDTLQIMYEEIENLYKDKLFLKFTKRNISEDTHYEELKKIIDICIKKNNYSQIGNYIMKNIIDKNKEKIEADLFNFINSGKYCKKENNNFPSQKLVGNNDKKDSNKYTQNIIDENNLEEKQEQLNPQKLKDINSRNSDENKNIIKLNLNSFISNTDKSESETLNNNENTLIKFSKTINKNIKDQIINKQDKDINEDLKSKINVKRAKSQYIPSFSKESKINNLINEEYDIKKNNYLNFFEKPDKCYLKNSKKELMMNIFSIYFYEEFFNDKSFKIMKNIFLQNINGINPLSKLLNYPSKIKNFNNGIEPCIFLKPYPYIYNDKVFSITHEYFCEFIKYSNMKIDIGHILLYKKIMPEFHLEEKFDEKCELIKINKNFFGHIIGSKLYNFLIFEELDFDFYKTENEISQDIDFNELFTLSLISKKPKVIAEQKAIKTLEESRIFKERRREKKRLIILFEEIDEIIEKRFLLMWQAIEIYLKNGKSYFFNFLNHEKCKKILDIFKNNLITKDKIREQDFFKKEKIITNEWVEERLSTFEYLLYINKYGTRTFNDTNQYPIFPWLIRVDEENKIVNRNLKFPILAQTERNKDFSMKKYEDDEESCLKFPIHCGTHYSTSSYIYYYLMRLEPYTTLLIKLQGYKQEAAERMFSNLCEILRTFNYCRDSREVIPEFFNNFEIFMNLNCADFGVKKNNQRIDDFIIENKFDKNTIFEGNYINEINVCDFVKFVIDNKKLLNSKKISNEINNWIDLIFGVEQLPESEKKRKNNYNVFYKESYEQNLNMFDKLKKYIDKKKETKEIIEKLSFKINLIVSFGQTPHQIFEENHPKFGSKTKNNEGDFEFDLNNLIWNKELKLKISSEPLFFIINQNSGKMLLINIERNLEILDNSLYSQKEEGNYKITKYGQLELPYIKIDNNSNIEIIKQKYYISSFGNKEYSSNSKVKSKDMIYEEDDDNNYNLYSNDYIKKLTFDRNKKEKKNKKSDEEEFKIITCRHIDNSFKIYSLPENKSNLKKNYKQISYICEDFVSSCCTFSFNQFFIGLKNGKLIKYTIENNEESNSVKDNKLNIKLNQQIKAHKGEIDIIEINKKIGIIITAGSDNNIFIRKLYDFELLTPIKIKEKYKILTVKISPHNLLYILCFSKKKKKSCILGYTLNGILFSKSPYENYVTLDFTKNGNIVSWINKEKIKVLYGYNLIYKNKPKLTDDKKSKEFYNKMNKLKGSTWIKFEYFSKKSNFEPNTKIITYTNTEAKNNIIKTLDVSEINYFD